VHHSVGDELLRRLAHPFWFQSFGAVMGMDWHSSGITTSVIGALKRGLAPLGSELGIYVCGGRGKHSRQTPHELVAIGERVGFDGSGLATASRLVAKADSAAASRNRQLDLLRSLGPDGIAREFRVSNPAPSSPPVQRFLPHLVMPAHHEVRRSDVFERRLQGTLAAAAERGPADFAQLLLVP